MNVLGIDPGTTATGFGLIRARGDRLHLLEAGVLRSASGLPLPLRIRQLCAELEALLDRARPDEIALEGLFAARNIRSALTLAQLRGAFLLILARREVLLAEYSPRAVKQAVTGQGGAPKEQVRSMVLRLLGTAAGASPVPLDASDALAVAICHAHTATGRRRRRPQAD